MRETIHYHKLIDLPPGDRRTILIQKWLIDKKVPVKSTWHGIEEKAFRRLSVPLDCMCLARTVVQAVEFQLSV